MELYESASGEFEGKWSSGDGEAKALGSEEERMIQNSIQKRLMKAGFELLKGNSPGTFCTSNVLHDL